MDGQTLCHSEDTGREWQNYELFHVSADGPSVGTSCSILHTQMVARLNESSCGLLDLTWKRMPCHRPRNGA